MRFKVERCIGFTSKGLPCHSDEEIDEYIKDVEINGWVVENNLKIMELEESPFTASTKLLYTELLNN